MSQSFRLAAVGDVMLSGGYWDRARANDLDGLFREVAPLLTAADVSIGNLEGPLTELPPDAPPWRFCLRGHPAYARVLRDGGMNVLCLANNHIMDCGWQGVEETMQHLSTAGIRYFGVGKDLSMARAPLEIAIRGARVAFLGYCDIPVNLPVYATEDRPGLAPANPEYMVEDIRAAKKNNDVVIVSLHWGQEMLLCPSPKQRKLAAELIAAGAAMVLGHHPHVLQGNEKVGRSLVCYSLGTYSVCEEEWIGKNHDGDTFRLMHMGPNDGWRRQAVLQVQLDANGAVLESRMEPIYIDPDMRVYPDRRPERLAEFERADKALDSFFYSLQWANQALRARVIDWAEHVGNGQPIWKIVTRIRPRHLKVIRNSLVNEWQQLRGLK